MRAAWSAPVTMKISQYPGHAEELARCAALDGFDVVVAAGGDGTVHEVGNGILRSSRADVSLAVVPIGSANDYAYSLQSLAWTEAGTGLVDVARVRSPDGRERCFVCCLGLGLNGAVTLESRRIRNLNGVALYGLATLTALRRHYRTCGMEVAIDDQACACLPTLMLSVLLGKREGGFVLAPNAALDDGKLDFVHAGALSRWEVLSFLPQLALSGPPTNHAKIRVGQCQRVWLRSPHPLIVHLDGEFFCRPEDGVRELEIEIAARRLPVRKWT